MRQLDRVAHRHLEDAGADLDAACHRGDDAHPDDWVEGRPAAPERIGQPQPGKAPCLDLARQTRKVFERPAGIVGIRPQEIDDMHLHRCLPISV